MRLRILPFRPSLIIVSVRRPIGCICQEGNGCENVPGWTDTAGDSCVWVRLLCHLFCVFCFCLMLILMSRSFIFFSTNNMIVQVALHMATLRELTISLRTKPVSIVTPSDSLVAYFENLSWW